MSFKLLIKKLLVYKSRILSITKNNLLLVGYIITVSVFVLIKTKKITIILKSELNSPKISQCINTSYVRISHESLLDCISYKSVYAFIIVQLEPRHGIIVISNSN